jgi:hypothetical protein
MLLTRRGMVYSQEIKVLVAVATLLFILSFTVTLIHNYIRTIHSSISIRFNQGIRGNIL